jgi:hypothetical protein
MPSVSVAKKVPSVPTASTASVSVASTAPVASSPAPTSVPEKKVVKSRPVSSSPAPACLPVVSSPAPVVSTTGLPPPVESEAEEISWQIEMKTVQDQLTAIRDATSLALSALKRLEKRASREIKDAVKNRRKARREATENGDRKPSVFKTPIAVSSELATFLGQPVGTLMTRSSVTKAISVYVKENKLNDKHAIKADAALQTLLGVKPTDELTIFNLQRYLNPHYPKTVVKSE